MTSILSIDGRPAEPVGSGCPRWSRTYFCRACGRFHLYKRTKLGVRRYSVGPITEDPLKGLSVRETFTAHEMQYLDQFARWIRDNHPNPRRSDFADEFSSPPAEFLEQTGISLGRRYRFPARLSPAKIEGIWIALHLTTETNELRAKLWRTIAEKNALPPFPPDLDATDNAIVGVTSGFPWVDIEFFTTVGGGVGARELSGYRTLRRNTDRLLTKRFGAVPGWVLPAPSQSICALDRVSREADGVIRTKDTTAGSR